MGKTYVFFDMDGCLAEYRIYCSFNDMKEKGYFGTLKPEWNMVEAFKKLLSNHKDNVEVYILTKVYPKVLSYSVQEKKEWIKQIMPFVPADHLIMVDAEQNVEKSQAIKNALDIDIDENCILIDDYNANLIEWAEKGGTPIKYVNGVNDKNKSFEGFRLSYFQNKQAIVDSLYKYIKIIKGE